VWPHGGISQFRCSPYCWGGDRLGGRMQDGTVTTESSPDRIGLVGCTPVERHSGMGTSVHALQSCSIYSYSRVLDDGQRLEDMFVRHVLGFLPPPIGECVVKRDCSWLEEREAPSTLLIRLQSLRCEERKFSHRPYTGVGCGDGALGDQVVPSCVESFGDQELDGDILFILYCCCLGNQSHFLVSFSPLRCYAT
jgi:hypothetical protein